MTDQMTQMTCPFCRSDCVQVFTADLDQCVKCEATFPGGHVLSPDQQRVRELEAENQCLAENLAKLAIENQKLRAACKKVLTEYPFFHEVRDVLEGIELANGGTTLGSD